MQKISTEHILAVQQPAAYCEIDLNAIRHNYQKIQKIASNQMVAGETKTLKLIWVVKANAYGHGMLEIANCLDQLGAEFFGVSNVDEGIALRKAGITKDILVFETTFPELAEVIIDHQLIPTVCTYSLAQELNGYAQSIGTKIDVHIKIDTGMGRLGVSYQDAIQFIERLRGLNHLNIKGIYTHFPVADTNGDYTINQIQDFIRLLQELEKRNIQIPFIHAANSMGILEYRNTFFNLARPGLMLYGLYPSATIKTKIHLKPAMSVRSRIIFIKRILKGQGVSYGHAFIAKDDMTVGILPIGYNDGYFRAFSNHACVLVSGVRCPIIGRVTMDQTIVDLSRVDAPSLGMPVTLLGEELGKSVTANELATLAGTINYEIICSLGNRLPRIYKN